MGKTIGRNVIIKSLVFKFIERISVKGIGLIISIVLARLLAPEAFGLVAILTVFINLSQMIIQSGFNTALVQNKDVTEEDYSTVFYINMACSIIIIAILFVIAPFVAEYYSNKQLTIMLRIYSISLIFGGYNSIQVSKFQKEMKFREMMISSLIATIVSGAIGVIMAYLGADIWSLIMYYMFNVALNCIAMLFFDSWRPHLVFSTNRAKVLFNYGWKMLVSGVLCSLYADIRSLVIGKVFSVKDLGYYNRGQQFPGIIANTLDTSIQAVMFPAIATEQDSVDRMRELLRKSMRASAFFILPSMIGLAIIAKPFIVLILTEKWVPCVIYMQLICIAEANIPFSSSNLIAIKSTGRSDIYMKLEIVRRLMMLLVLISSVVFFRSVFAVAVGYVISCWIDVLIIMHTENKILNYDIKSQFFDVKKIIVATLLMGVVTYSIGLLQIASFVKLVIQIFVAIAVYVGFCHIIKEETYLMFLKIVKDLKKR